MACFCMLLCGFPLFFLSFFPLMTENMKKLVLTQKQTIFTSKRHAEHLFAGQNTQYMGKYQSKKDSFSAILSKVALGYKSLNTSNVQSNQTIPISMHESKRLWLGKIYSEINCKFNYLGKASAVQLQQNFEDKQLPQTKIRLKTHCFQCQKLKPAYNFSKHIFTILSHHSLCFSISRLYFF